jgi:hypothetical protein
MVLVKIPDDPLKIDRQVHRLLVDREMLVPGHHSYRPKKSECRGEIPPAPPKGEIICLNHPH